MRFGSVLVVGLALLMAGCGANHESGSANSSPASKPAMSLPKGVTLVETVKADPSGINIPYSKYVLDNGLTVVLHEDHSDPLLHVDVTYHVGSAREEVGKSGFAHFFEHMMFQGSEHVADEEHFKIVSESGGTLNGSTNTDRTNYFETVPSNQLEKMLWLESDRMGYLLDAVTQEKFEVQRATVKNERGQNYDNRPYGLLREKVNQALYPEGHPYSWLTIGYVEDLDRVDVNDLKKFFLRWYGPNNATLTIGGDIDPAQTLQWVVKYFGPIPAGPEVDDMEKIPVHLDKDRYISMEDNVALPLLYMAWPTVYQYHKDEAPLDVLMSILGSGRTSLLYKNLVKPGLAVQASAGHGCQELSCTFTMYALPNPAKGTSLTDLESVARKSLEEFETRGVTDDDLARVKAGIVSDMIYGLESVRGKVSRLAAYETFRDDANYIGKDIARYENVSKQDVMRVYAQYIKGQPAVIMSVLPRGKNIAPAHADTWKPGPRELPEYAKTEASSLHLRHPKDDFDRSVQPAAGPNPQIHLPEIWHDQLPNGIKVIGAQNTEVPTTTISLGILAGNRSVNVEQVGLPAMTAGMMNEATQVSSNEELSNRLQKLGSSVNFRAGDQYTTLFVRSLTQNLDPTLDIAMERLFQPKFDEADFTRLQAQTIQGIRAQSKDASATASAVFSKLLYGADNAFAWPSNGSEASVRGFTVGDVKGFYQTWYKPEDAVIIVVGNLGHEEMMAHLQRFANWQGTHPTLPEMKPFPQIAGGTLYFVDKPGAAQSEIRIGKRALPFDAMGEYYRLGLMNYNLGGAFNSRININLREDKGYTYGARSYFSGDKDTGDFRASAGVRANVTEQSIIEFNKEIQNYAANGMTVDELKFLKNSIGQRDALKYETPGQKARLLSYITTYDLPDDFAEAQSAILAGISLDELNALAHKYLDLAQMITVVVGDRKTVMPTLQQLGEPIVELTTDGNPREKQE